VTKHRSERPVKPRRLVRRSMAELAGSLQSAEPEKSPVERRFATTAGKPSEQKVEDGASQRKPAEAAREYRAWAFKLMTAHVKANLQYAHKLMRSTSPFDFIELSTDHARKQFELIMSQTAALGELSRSLTIVGAERMATGTESVVGRQEK
jgi:hypothetical protein